MPPKRGNSSKSGGSSSNKKQFDTPTGTVLQLTFTSMEKMAAALARISAYIEDPEYEGIPIMLGQIDEVDVCFDHTMDSHAVYTQISLMSYVSNVPPSYPLLDSSETVCRPQLPS